MKINPVKIKNLNEITTQKKRSKNTKAKNKKHAKTVHFSKSKAVELIRVASVGNHFHLHIKILNRELYKAWIRGLISGIAMNVLGLQGLKTHKKENKKFWDYRPFSRVVQNYRSFLYLNDYLTINQLEGAGVPRAKAIFT